MALNSSRARRAQPTSNWKRNDTVRIPGFPEVGVVRRVARDGSWVDVWWLQSTDQGDTAWIKRQPNPSKLRKATRAQNSLLAIWIAIQEAVELGYLERVSA
jgi:hypothetical protein